MGKLATYAPRAPRSSIQSAGKSFTYEGGDGFALEEKSELFLLSVSNMVGEDTFYESASDRDSRYTALIAAVTKSDPDWIARFVPYLRNTMNMRSASIVMAVEYVIAGGPSGRRVIDSAISRPDEAGEVIGYYRSRVGRSLPQPIKRGVADAVRRLYDERSYLKYGKNGTYTFKDVIRIAHPEPSQTWQNALFGYIVSDQTEIPEVLDTLAVNRQLMNVAPEDRKSHLTRIREIQGPEAYPEWLRRSGLTWESLSGWLQGPMDAAAWESIIPTMGYMALLRNLRNFEEAGISDKAQRSVIERLSDPEAVARSRQFPIRFYSAYSNLTTLTYASALEKALDLSLQNIPTLKGRTLVLVDNSSSMTYGKSSAKSKIRMSDIAELFGAALAKRSEHADLYGFSDRHQRVSFSGPLLRIIDTYGRTGGGTYINRAISATFEDHDRIVVLTDGQTFDRYDSTAQIKVPVFEFNLAGYKTTAIPSGSDNRYVFGGGLTDNAFRMIPLLEAGKNADWPF